MNAVVVGADRLGNIPETLSAMGIRIACVCCRRSAVCIAESVQRCLAQHGGCAARLQVDCDKRRNP